MAQELKSLQSDWALELQRQRLRVVTELPRLPASTALNRQSFIIGLYHLSLMGRIFRAGFTNLVLQARLTEPLVLGGASLPRSKNGLRLTVISDHICVINFNYL